MQITIEITVVGANDHTPMFGQDDYSVNLQEYNAITMMTPVTAGQVVITVTATDLDDPTTLAGMLEYQILSGAMQFGVEMFSIPNPSVSIFIIAKYQCKLTDLSLIERHLNRKYSYIIGNSNLIKLHLK